MKGYNAFKVTFTPSITDEAEFVKEYNTLAAAFVALNAIADYTLLLHETSLMPDYSNFGTVYKNTPDEWVEVDEYGQEI